jgi:hypothetical protein
MNNTRTQVCALGCGRNSLLRDFNCARLCDVDEVEPWQPVHWSVSAFTQMSVSHLALFARDARCANKWEARDRAEEGFAVCKLMVRRCDAGWWSSLWKELARIGRIPLTGPITTHAGVFQT